jgi:hypothetical protein
MLAKTCIHKLPIRGPQQKTSCIFHHEPESSQANYLKGSDQRSSGDIADIRKFTKMSESLIMSEMYSKYF